MSKIDDSTLERVVKQALKKYMAEEVSDNVLYSYMRRHQVVEIVKCVLEILEELSPGAPKILGELSPDVMAPCPYQDKDCREVRSPMSCWIGVATDHPVPGRCPYL